MKDELIKYATYTVMYDNPFNCNESFFFSNKALKICVPIMLVACSLAMLVKLLYAWIALLIIWILMLVVRAKEKDAYLKALLIDGTVEMYFAIFCSYIYILSSNVFEKKYVSPILFLAFVLGALLIYEIIFIIKIKLKRYSHSKQKALARKKKTVNVGLIASASILGASLGVRHQFTIFPPAFKSVSFPLGISLVFLCGCVSFQKYLIFKLLNRDNQDQ